MVLPPIIQRELRVALRKAPPMRARFIAAASGGALCGTYLLVGLVSGATSWGPSLHRWLFLVCLIIAVIKPAQACLGLFCDERRNQTFELLYITGMGAFEFFAGKLIGGMLVASSEFLALIPFLALPFLSGGVSLELFLATLVCVPLLLLFIVAATLLASVLCREEGAVIVLTLAIVAMICVMTPLPFIVGHALTGSVPFPREWLWLSPAYGALLVGLNPRFGPITEFWRTAGFLFAWAILLLGLSGALLRRSWRNAPEKACRKGAWRSWVRGSDGWRRALRGCVLGVNAFQWLAQRDRQPILLAWCSAGMISIIWLAGWCAWPQRWLSALNFWLTTTALLTCADALRMTAAARRMAEDRRDGMLELLLTTPLTPEQILQGQLAAVRNQFRPLRQTLLGISILLMLAGFALRSWTVGAVISYLVIWALLLAWSNASGERQILFAMWVALNSGRSAFSVIRAQGGIVGVWWWAFLLAFMQGWFSFGAGIPKGSPEELMMVIIVLAFVFISYFAARDQATKVRKLFLERMRQIAQQPVPDRTDPRFDKWKQFTEPFPA